MSIASELSTLAANKAAIKAAIEAKSPATAPTDALAQWPTSIASIQPPIDVAKVAYIGFNSQGEYILTGLYYFPDFEVDVEVPSNNTMRVLYTDNTHQLERKSSDFPYWHIAAGGDYISNVSIVGRHIISLRNGVITIDGELQETLSTRTWASGYELGVPFNSTSYTYTFKLYSLKCWDSNGDLVRDYDPIRIGTTGYLYDNVSKSIFRNLGTGAFTYGSDI